MNAEACAIDALVTSFSTKNDSTYNFNGITYTVASVFDTNNTLAEKVFRIVDLCFAQLMPEENSIILDNEYTCSTAGKEDLCSQ
ncbi:MAG: hypothetical protein PHV32_07840 [Eubacteriales bacterium]|nr:hypothetical protein [Eubacteriales bacterium]